MMMGEVEWEAGICAYWSRSQNRGLCSPTLPPKACGRMEHPVRWLGTDGPPAGQGVLTGFQPGRRANCLGINGG
jgi:hypothetical protein